MIVLIRDARPADLPAIVEIYNQSVPGRNATADLEAITVESRKKWFSEHSPHSRPLWVAEMDGNVAAWLSFRSFYGRPAYRHTAELGLYVREGFHGRGIASRMLEKAIIDSPDIDLKNLLGFIFAHNAVSIHLFKKYGFVKWGELPGIAVFEGTERSLVIMGRKV